MLKALDKVFLPFLFAVAIDGFQLLISAALLATGPFGIILGFVISACISLTFGAALITFLWLSDLLYPKIAFGFLFSETVPVFDSFPLWTGLVLMCGFKKLQEEKGRAGAIARAAQVAIKPTPGAVLGAIRSRSVDGITGRS